MDRKRSPTRRLALAGLIAAVYTAATLILPIPQYLGVQFRVAEAMTVLPFLFPEAVPGLAVGCFLANLLGSPIMLDWIFGTLATLLAALWSRRMPNVWLAALPPVVCNAAIVGAEIAWYVARLRAERPDGGGRRSGGVRSAGRAPGADAGEGPACAGAPGGAVRTIGRRDREAVPPSLVKISGDVRQAPPADRT